MAINSKDRFAELPEARRRAIMARAKELIAEELTLGELRKVRERSQAKIAELLGIKQAAVSRLERRADMYLSTIRDYIEAVGGTFEIVARFPDRAPVRINQLRILKPPVKFRRVHRSLKDRDAHQATQNPEAPAQAHPIGKPPRIRRRNRT
jgi:transcriptional regulator with XRE-family HTH domain